MARRLAAGETARSQHLETLQCLGVNYPKVIILGPTLDKYTCVSLCARQLGDQGIQTTEL